MQKYCFAVFVASLLVAAPPANAQWVRRVNVEVGDILHMQVDVSDPTKLWCGVNETSGNLKLVDVSDPERPTTMTTTTLGNGPVYQFAQTSDGNKMYSFDYDKEETGHIYSFREIFKDTDDLTSLTLGNKVKMPTPGARIMAIDDTNTTVLIGTAGGIADPNEVRIVNVSSVPVWRQSEGVNLGSTGTSSATLAAANGIVIQGERAVLAIQNATLNRNFQIRGFPDLQTLIGSVIITGGAYSVATTPDPDEFLVGTDNHTSGDLLLFRVNGSTPEFKAGLELGDKPVRSISTVGWNNSTKIAVAVLQTDIYQPLTIVPVNVTDPYNPMALSPLEISEGVKAYAVTIVNGVIIIAVSTNGVSTASSTLTAKDTPPEAGSLQVYAYTGEPAQVANWELYE